MALHPVSRPQANPDLSPAIERDARAGYEGLVATRRLLSEASNAIAREPNRMGAWRLVANALEARKAFQVHTGICNSEAGPLLHLLDSRPELGPSLQALFDDHARIFGAIDHLIARATATRGDNQGAVEILRAASASAQASLSAYEIRFHDLAFEWANRDIGGES
jgi:hypothetical protein